MVETGRVAAIRAMFTGHSVVEPEHIFLQKLRHQRTNSSQAPFMEDIQDPEIHGYIYWDEHEGWNFQMVGNPVELCTLKDAGLDLEIKEAKRRYYQACGYDPLEEEVKSTVGLSEEDGRLMRDKSTSHMSLGGESIASSAVSYDSGFGELGLTADDLFDFKAGGDECVALGNSQLTERALSVLGEEPDSRSLYSSSLTPSPKPAVFEFDERQSLSENEELESRPPTPPTSPPPGSQSIKDDSSMMRSLSKESYLTCSSPDTFKLGTPTENVSVGPDSFASPKSSPSTPRSLEMESSERKSSPSLSSQECRDSETKSVASSIRKSGEKRGRATSNSPTQEIRNSFLSPPTRSPPNPPVAESQPPPLDDEREDKVQSPPSSNRDVRPGAVSPFRGLDAEAGSTQLGSSAGMDSSRQSTDVSSNSSLQARGQSKRNLELEEEMRVVEANMAESRRDLMMMPLPNDGTLLRCYIERAQGSCSLGKRRAQAYSLFLESGSDEGPGIFLLAAWRKKNSHYVSLEQSTVWNKATRVCEPGKKNGHVLARVRRNWKRNDYMIYDNGLKPKSAGQSYVQKGAAGLLRFELGLVKICPSEESSGGPGKNTQIQVHIPFDHSEKSLTQWTPNMDGRISEAVRANKTEDLLELNSMHLNYSHSSSTPRDTDFGFQSRALQPWRKNLGFVSHELDKKIMEFGQLDRDRFALEFTYPLSPMQAFSLSLVILDSS